MTETTVLYALSTLAQTCAALAAFVGAVGIFRLQVLREQRRETERELRGLAAQAGAASVDWVMIFPIDRILHDISVKLAAQRPAPGSELSDRLEALEQGLDRWQSFSPRLSSSRWVLFFFEGWNLFVIGVALVGFNYVPALASWPGTRCVLWLVALGTVVLTFACVAVWTGEGRWFSETLRNMWNRLRGRTAP